MSKFYDLKNNYTMNNFNKIEIRKLFNKAKKEKMLFAKSFDSNVWLFVNDISPDRKIYVDFKIIKPYSRIIDIDILKAFVINLSLRKQPKTIGHYYTSLKKFLKLSNGFDIEKLDDVRDSILNKNTMKNSYNMVHHVTEYVEFSDIEIDIGYLILLDEAKYQLKYERNISVLPKSSNILTFSYYLEKYYSEGLMEERNPREKEILYYPILLWWKITLIIPMRIGEFCYMPRDCFFQEDKKYFLEFRRNKGERKEEKFEIDHDTYQLLQRYINLTENMGVSKTLISYMSVVTAKRNISLAKRKADPRYFNIENFSHLLRYFYDKIIEDKYGIYLPDEEKLRPNYTRHLSFISLMMQGYNPYLIKELGGHETIEKQYEYSFHPEYWVDNEIYQLKSKYNLEKLNFDNDTASFDNNIAIKAFMKGTSNFRGDLAIGYCSDSEQRCESFTSCFFCSHWRIDPKELIEKKEEIIAQINEKRSDIVNLVRIYMNMIKNIYYEDENSNSINIDTETEPMKNKINLEIENLYKLHEIIDKVGGND